MNNQRRQYWINLLSTFMSQAFTAASIILLTPILLNNLGDQLFGAYGILLNLMLFFAIFDLGFNIGLLRRLIHEKEKASELISTCFIFFCFIFPIAWAILFGSMQLGWFLNTDQAIILNKYWITCLLALLVMVNMQATLFDVVLQSLNKIFVGKLIRIIKTIIEFGLIWWASKQQSLVVLIGVLVLVNTLYVGCMFMLAKKAISFQLIFPANFLATMLSHVQYSYWYAFSALAGVLIYNAQTILMGNQLNAATVTKFVVIAKFYEVVRTGLANFTVILFPSISKLESDGHWKEILQQFSKVFLRILGLVLISTIVMFTIGEYFFTYWSGFSDQETILVFRLYTIMIMLLVIEHVAVVFLAALKLNRLPTLVSILQGIVGLSLSYWLMQYAGLKGALYGSLIAMLLTSFFFNPIYLFLALRKNALR